MTREDNTPISTYLLIDYGRPHAHEYTAKKVKMTELEAHDLNYAFALNKAGKRYIKDKKC
jgi:hypothetical protein